MPLSKPKLTSIWQSSQQGYLPEYLNDPESIRLSNLIVGFATMGGVFSVFYALYYLWIGHYFGAIAILSNSLVFITVPLWCVRKNKPDLGALSFILALIVMFCWLALTEGGINGHAVAWLATMPFCSQLLILKRRSVLWVNGLMLLLIAVFSGEEIWGISFPTDYSAHHHGWVTLIGYTGLGIFMFTLGFIGEYYRREVMKERDSAEEELKTAVDELTRLNLEKNEFLGIAAHDLNNPLTVVSGYAEMLMEDEHISKEDFRVYIREISENSNRMRKIVQDVLDVNTIESGRYPLNMEEVNLRPLFENCLQSYQAATKKKLLKMTPKLMDVRAFTDTGALGQILDNLISNAVKYAKPGGEIRVSLFEVSKGFCFEVYNEGRGFSEEDKTKLFFRFAKLSTRPTAGEGSVGLGLSITHKIVEALSGEIECVSTLNQGALFRVTLPGRTSLKL